MKNIIVTAFCFFISNSVTTNAQTFFYKNKTGEKELTKINLDFSVDENLSIQFTHPENLSKFIPEKSSINRGKISKRSTTKTEQTVQGGLWVLTGFLVLPMYDAYDLNSDLKLMSTRGLIFFVFPFESHNLYRTCKGQDYLIATSQVPNAEMNQKLKSLEELHKLCDSEASDPDQKSS